MLDCKKTYERPGVGKYDKVHVKTPGSGLDKRQCTLQLLISAENNLARVEIIFRGKHGGKFISKAQKKHYHPDVDVFFQPNAWADSEFSEEWINKTLKPAVAASKDEFILFCDNLSCQVKDQFKSAVRKLNGIVYYGPANATDQWQPIDKGYGYLMKNKIRQMQEDWLMEGDNIDIWHGNSEQKLTVGQRRILLTQWVAGAAKSLQGPDYDRVRKSYFERTGCLITADGSEDDQIKPEGLPNFKVIPPMTNPENEIELEIATPEPVEAPADVIEPESESEEEVEDMDEQNMEIDDENDRVYNVNLVGNKIHGLYDGSGWNTETVKYYISKLN